MRTSAVVMSTLVVGIVHATGDGANGSRCNKTVEEGALYLKASTATHDRVADLLDRLCWEEKVSQLGGVGGLLERNSTFNETQYRDRARLHNGTISPGSYLNDAKEAIPVLAQLIVSSKEESRLRIPYIHVGDGVNGITLLGTTFFPATLSMSTSWNLPLYKSVVKVLREEFYAAGINWILSPDVDVARDPRFGRIGETYGEDPWLNGEYGTSFIQTMEQKDSGGFLKVATTIKHYLYGTNNGGINQGSMLGGVNHIFNTLAKPYIDVFKKVMPASIMPSYSTIDGVPAHTNHYLLQEVLRRQLGFDGVIVSDADAITMLRSVHKTAISDNDAGIQALGAGVQLELAIQFPTAFETLVGNGTNDDVVREVNEAVRRLLDLKFRTGLFDKDLKANTTALEKVLRSDKHLKIAKEMSREAVVLLKNDGVLPAKSVSKVAVIGPFAEIVNGGTYAAWTNADNKNKTLLDAAKGAFGKENVKFVKGVGVLDTVSSDIDSAVAAAKDAGLAIVALGAVAVGWEDPLLSQKTDGEGATHASLKLPGLQEELLSAVIDAGVPTILVLSGGQSFELHGAAAGSNAIIHGFLAGEFTAEALVDIITGKVNPSGKLTVTFPVSSEVNPVYYDRVPSDWQDSNSMTFPGIADNYIYPFGHGLSYTSFEFSDISVDRTQYGKRDIVTVSCKLSNTGDVEGKEVVQVYFSQQVAAITLPTKRLIGTTKVKLAPGASTRVQIKVPVDDFGYWYNSKYRVDSGSYSIYVGNSSEWKSLSKPVNVTIS